MGSKLISQLNNVRDLSSLEVFSRGNLAPYNKLISAFTSALSRTLLATENKHISEFVALGFWLRESNLSREFKHQFTSFRKPIGLVVHYTPANVDTMFVYSWICSLVCGNRNIIRLNSTLSELQTILLNCILEVISKPEFEAIAKTNFFIQYDKSLHELAETISQSADARIMWGGDDSVTAIRQLAIKPRCRDIIFSDRYSASILDGNELSETNIADVAERFYRDIHPFEQQACSSPKILFWKGNTTFQSTFFSSLNKKFKANVSVTLKNEQLVMSQSMAAEGKLRKIHAFSKVTVLEILSAPPLDISIHKGQFSIWLVEIDSIGELGAYCDEKMQTLSYWGVDKEELVKFLANPSINGIDRLAPMGQALSFSTQWDGYTLVDQLTRIISVE